MVDKFPDGVWMFELAGLDRPDGLEQSMLATLGRSNLSVPATARQALLEMTGSWRALLIMDNCEHLLPACGGTGGRPAGGGAELTVLATSREPLHAPGERVLPVAPLAVADEAVALFVDRAVAVRPSFVAEGQNYEAVLRYLPAPGRRALGDRVGGGAHGGHDARPRSMAGCINGFGCCRSYPRAGDRHGSMQRVVDWSYDLLEEEARSCLSAVGFLEPSTPRPLTWCAAVMTSSPRWRWWQSLVDKSLVVAAPRGARTSYRLLETDAPVRDGPPGRGDEEQSCRTGMVSTSPIWPSGPGTACGAATARPGWS